MWYPDTTLLSLELWMILRMLSILVWFVFYVFRYYPNITFTRSKHKEVLHGREEPTRVNLGTPYTRYVLEITIILFIIIVANTCRMETLQQYGHS